MKCSLLITFFFFFPCRFTLICFLWKRECKQNCYTLWERSLATWHEMLWALFSLSHFFYFIFFFLFKFQSSLLGHLKKTNQKWGGWRDVRLKLWKRCIEESPVLCRGFAGWMSRRRSEQMESKKMTVGRKSQTTEVDPQTVCCLQCQNWPREGNLEPTPALQHRRHPGD